MDRQSGEFKSNAQIEDGQLFQLEGRTKDAVTPPKPEF